MAAQYGILFDVDGVIADSEAVNVRATRQAFAELLGITGVETEDFEAGIGRGAAEYVRAGARAHGRELSDEEVEGAVQARQDNFTSCIDHPGLSVSFHPADNFCCGANSNYFVPVYSYCPIGDHCNLLLLITVQRSL